MKMQILKTTVIGPVLLLIPMASMHLGGGHHFGPHHFMLAHPSFQSSIHGMFQGDRMGMEEMRTP